VAINSSINSPSYLDQWRSAMERSGAVAPGRQAPWVTFPIRPDPLTFFIVGGVPHPLVIAMTIVFGKLNGVNGVRLYLRHSFMVHKVVHTCIVSRSCSRRPYRLQRRRCCYCCLPLPQLGCWGLWVLTAAYLQATAYSWYTVQAMRLCCRRCYLLHIVRYMKFDTGRRLSLSSW